MSIREMKADDLKRIVELEKRSFFYHHGMKKILYMN